MSLFPWSADSRFRWASPAADPACVGSGSEMSTSPVRAGGPGCPRMLPLCVGCPGLQSLASLKLDVPRDLPCAVTVRGNHVCHHRAWVLLQPGTQSGKVWGGAASTESHRLGASTTHICPHRSGGREPGVGVPCGCRRPGIRGHGAAWLRACFLVSLHGGEREPGPLTPL